MFSLSEYSDTIKRSAADALAQREESAERHRRIAELAQRKESAERHERFVALVRESSARNARDNGNGKQERGRTTERTEATSARGRPRSSSREREREHEAYPQTRWISDADSCGTKRVGRAWDRFLAWTDEEVTHNTRDAVVLGRRPEPLISWPPVCSSWIERNPEWTRMFRGHTCETVVPVVIQKNDDDEARIVDLKKSMQDADELSFLTAEARVPIVLQQDKDNNILFGRFFAEAAPQRYDEFLYLVGTYTRDHRTRSKVQLTLAVHRAGVEQDIHGKWITFDTVVPFGSHTFEMPRGCTQTSVNGSYLTTEVLMFLDGLNVVLPHFSKSVSPALAMVKRTIRSHTIRNNNTNGNVHTWTVEDKELAKATGSFALLLHAEVKGVGEAELYA